MIYGGVGRLQASAADCVGQPYHLPSDLIVTLLTELAQVENQGSPGRSLDGAARPPNRWIKRRLPCFCASACACASVRVLRVCGRRRCSRSPPPTSASLFGEDFVRAGRRSMNASAGVFPSPPPALAKQEQLLLGKKRKEKKKFLEFQAPWNYFVRQELSSEALRFRREVRSGVLQFGAFL